MNTKNYIFINLLPYREKRKKEQTKQFILLMAFFALVSVFILFVTYSYFSVNLDNQNSRNDFISKRNKKLDDDIKAISNLRNEIRDTLAKRRVVEELQVNRSDSVGILNDISLQLPEGMTLKSIAQNGNQITLTGSTNSNNKISNYMTNLSNTSTFINPQLVEVRAARTEMRRTAGQAVQEQTISDFTLNVYLKPKQDIVEQLNNVINRGIAPVNVPATNKRG
jgi:type IV pilus assembly protein PilN